MKKYKLHTNYKKRLADTYTPVGIYLKLRDKFPNSILLESSDYHGNENSFSFICCDPIAAIKVENGFILESFPDGEKIRTKLTPAISIPDAIKKFVDRFDPDSYREDENKLKFINTGLFGYTSYDAVRYFEEIELNPEKKAEKEIPDLIYSVYRYVIAIDHFKDEMYLAEHYINKGSGLAGIESMIDQRNFAQYKFSLNGTESSNLTDGQYISMVKKGKEECKRGNIFQVVLSREFMQRFKGDEFNLYRALRSVNPSPYLFYFDLGNFKIFGSSPEAQVIVKNNSAEVHPIAGTVKRSGDDEKDAGSVLLLRNDAKENSEHVMLVDLGRNDLSKNCSDVNVEVFAETQYYSHVIHLVSKVTGKLKPGASSIRVFADTFPAGTLSGAPKRKAMQIIDACENDPRGYYGGCIGFIGFNGDLNQAIIIRSFLSKNNKLFYRAGAGVVIASAEENELQEVNNKLGALRSAIELAKNI